MSPAISNNQKKNYCNSSTTTKRPCFLSVWAKTWIRLPKLMQWPIRSYRHWKSRDSSKSMPPPHSFWSLRKSSRNAWRNGKITGRMKNSNKSVNSWKQLPPNIVSVREALILFINGWTNLSVNIITPRKETIYPASYWMNGKPLPIPSPCLSARYGSANRIRKLCTKTLIKTRM